MEHLAPPTWESSSGWSTWILRLGNPQTDGAPSPSTQGSRERMEHLAPPTWKSLNRWSTWSLNPMNPRADGAAGSSDLEIPERMEHLAPQPKESASGWSTLLLRPGNPPKDGGKGHNWVQAGLFKSKKKVIKNMKFCTNKLKTINFIFKTCPPKFLDFI